MHDPHQTARPDCGQQRALRATYQTARRRNRISVRIKHRIAHPSRQRVDFVRRQLMLHQIGLRMPFALAHTLLGQVVLPQTMRTNHLQRVLLPFLGQLQPRRCRPYQPPLLELMGQLRSAVTAQFQRPAIPSTEPATCDS